MTRFLRGALASLSIGLLLFAGLAPSAAFAAGVRASLSGGINGSYLGTNALGTVQALFNQSFPYSFTEGVSANQADKLFSDNRTITASSSENLDLAGVLADPFGSTLTFVTVKAIIIQAAAGNTNDVILGGAASNTFTGPFGGATHTIAVRPGGLLMLVAPATGWTVTASTGDLLKVANSSSGSSVSYKIIVIGTSA